LIGPRVGRLAVRGLGRRLEALSMIKVTRRQLLAASGGMAAWPLLVGGCAATRKSSPSLFPVPSGRADGVRTGGARKVAIAGDHEVWVKQLGHGEIPVLTLHGGPGAPHFYLECFEDFLPPDRLRFWYYDQLGCGFSDRPDDPSLWTVERFREEVEQVRAGIGRDRLVLYGHSWGGMLAIEYALAYPQHVVALVISNMTASIPSYVAHVTKLRDALPADVKTAMNRFEERGDYEAPEYQQLIMEHLYAQHLCRLDPWPEPILRAMVNMNQQVYETMQGPSEFTVTGNFKDWDRWSDLDRIGVPTLLLVGRHDTMAVADIEHMGRLIPKARVVICENGSHFSMYDDQEAYFAALVPFLLESHGSRG
jgi:proline iminopeptidase